MIKNKFAFVILNYKNYQVTLELLRNLTKHSWVKDVNIYVVDNGSNNESVTELQKVNYLKFKLIAVENNLGFANGMNLGIEKAREDECNYVCLVNSDIEIPITEIDFLEKITNTYHQDNKIAVIAPSITDLDGLEQNPMLVRDLTKYEILKKKLFYLTGFYHIYYFLRVYLFYSIVNYFSEKRHIAHRAKVKKRAMKESQYIYIPHGSFIILTPTYFNCWNSLDKNTFIYCEEIILAEHVKQNNLKIWFENTLKVTHKESKSTFFDNKKEKLKFILSNTFKSCRYFMTILGKGQ